MRCSTAVRMTIRLSLFLAAIATAIGGVCAQQASASSPPFLTRIKAKFEVGGDLRMAADAKPATLPMSVVARFEYSERRIDDGSLPGEKRSLRYYTDAEAAIKVEKHASISKLPTEKRLIRSAVTQKRASLGAARGQLTREERDLLDLPFNTLLLNDLLPSAASQKGSRAKPSEGLLAMLLGLDAVSRSDVETVLTAVTAEVGEIAIEGAVDGVVGGQATEIELKGKLHFDMNHRQAFALAMLIKEKRSAGPVAPGLDVVARLELEIAPVAEVPQLSDKALAEVELATTGDEPPLAYHSAEGKFSFVYDPRWRITREQAESVVMRLVDRGDLVAQCNVSVLPKLNPQQVFTLEQFQKEVQQSLGKNFRQFEQAAEQKSATGLRMLQVVALGAVAEVPITWHYYLLINEAGQRAAISFTMEDTLADRFGAADRLVLDEFRFDPPPVRTASQPRIRVPR
ncbi:MAG TPA: hypothetical protein VJ809_12425 [Pirellulales bacterium]|nr:hypothetical protein [Pirellulales bacterium]